MSFGRKTIPSFEGLSPDEQVKILRVVAPKVLRRWQVFVPVILNIAFVFFLNRYVPAMPFRLLFCMAIIAGTILLALKAYEHFLEKEVQELKRTQE